jgi:phosphatidylglycerophosphate synthase
MEDNRRPINTRSAGWAKRFTALLVSKNIRPNQISVFSIFCALVGAGALLLGSGTISSIIAIAGIQLRLLCNLFDGMVAVEGNQKSTLGSLFNEFPDRIADSLLIVSLGYCAGLPAVGWFAALVAALTAYVRVFGGSLGLPQSFRGPMAKQHRMAIMTIALAINIVECWSSNTHFALIAGLGVIALGSVATCVTRTMDIAKQLQAVKHVDQ